MKRIWIAACAATLALGAAAPAVAGPYSDTLSKCLVASTDANDQQVFVRWIFSVMAANPGVAGYAKIAPDQRKAFSHDAAKLYERLLLKDCRTETTQAIKYEGALSLQAAFGTLGQAAMLGLMGESHVRAEMNALQSEMDDPEMDAFVKELGLTTPGKHD